MIVRRIKESFFRYPVARKTVPPIRLLLLWLALVTATNAFTLLHSRSASSRWMQPNPRSFVPKETKERRRNISSYKRHGWTQRVSSPSFMIADPSDEAADTPFFVSNAVNGAIGTDEASPAASPSKNTDRTPRTMRRTVNDPVLSMTDSVMEVFSSFGKLFSNLIEHTMQQQQTEDTKEEALHASAPPPLSIDDVNVPNNVTTLDEKVLDRWKDESTGDIITPLDATLTAEDVSEDSVVADFIASEIDDDDDVVVELDTEELNRWNESVDSVVELNAEFTVEDLSSESIALDLVESEVEDDSVVVELNTEELDRWNESVDSVVELDATLTMEDVSNDSIALDLVESEVEDDSVVVELNTEELDRWNESVDSVVELDAPLTTGDESEDFVAKLPVGDSDSLVVELDTEELDRWIGSGDRIKELEATITTAELSSDSFALDLEESQEDDGVVVELDTDELDRWIESGDEIVQLEETLTTADASSDSFALDLEESQEDDGVVVELDTEELDRLNESGDEIVQLEETLTTADVSSDSFALDLEESQEDDGVVVELDTEELDRWNESGDRIVQLDATLTTEGVLNDSVLETDTVMDMATTTADADDEIEFSMDDLEASIQMAQKSMDGTISGISMNFGDDDTPMKNDFSPPMDDASVDPLVDAEQLALAARLAVEAFERKQEEERQSIQRQREIWSNNQISLDDVAEVNQGEPGNTKTKKQLEDVSTWKDMTVNQLKSELEILGLSKTGTKATLIARLEENQKKVRGSGASAKSDSIPDEKLSPVTLKDWSACRVADLRNELLSRGLPTTGKKADLVLALQQSDLEMQKNSDSAVDSVASIDFSRIAEELVEDSSRLGNGDVMSQDDDEFQDMEELARAAREAVALFERTNTENESMLDDELEIGDSSFATDDGIMDGLFDDDIDIDDVDLDALGKAAREAVMRLEPDDDEPSDEALWEIENEISMIDEAMMVPEDDDVGHDLFMVDNEVENALPPEPPPNYASLAVSQLKEELNRRGLRVTGKKVDLIARLEASDKDL